MDFLWFTIFAQHLCMFDNCKTYEPHRVQAVAGVSYTKHLVPSFLTQAAGRTPPQIFGCFTPHFLCSNHKWHGVPLVNNICPKHRLVCLIIAKHMNPPHSPNSCRSPLYSKSFLPFRCHPDTWQEPYTHAQYCTFHLGAQGHLDILPDPSMGLWCLSVPNVI